MLVTITLTTIGDAISNTLNLTANVGSVSPSTATKAELLAGKIVTVSDSATVITVTSTGTCTTATPITISGIPAPTSTPGPTATPVVPTATPATPTSTPVGPTSTPVPPTATPVTPTATPVTPTATPVTPTSTPVVPTATPFVTGGPTATPVVSTPTPTSTPFVTGVSPTATPVEPTATPPTPTTPPLYGFFHSGPSAFPNGHCNQNQVTSSQFYSTASSISFMLNTQVFIDTTYEPWLGGGNNYYAVSSDSGFNTNNPPYQVIQVDNSGYVTDVQTIDAGCGSNIN